MDANQRKSKRRSIDQWRSIVRRFEHSELTVVEFCQQAGVSVSNFYHWRHTLSKMSAGSSEPVDAIAAQSSPQNSFVKLGELRSQPHAPSSDAPMELYLELGAGLSLRLVRR